LDEQAAARWEEKQLITLSSEIHRGASMGIVYTAELPPGRLCTSGITQNPAFAALDDLALVAGGGEMRVEVVSRLELDSKAFL
jgi:hypothetical protein